MGGLAADVAFSGEGAKSDSIMTNESPSPVLAMLLDAKQKAQAVIDSKRLEIAELDKAIGAVSGESALHTERGDAGQPETKNPMQVGDAIILAVEKGYKTPAAIYDYLTREVGVQTTIGSVRARLSPLKSEGKVAHDGEGWIPISKEADIGDLLS